MEREHSSPDRSGKRGKKGSRKGVAAKSKGAGKGKKSGGKKRRLADTIDRDEGVLYGALGILHEVQG